MPTETKMHECDKFLLTPESSNCNPHCQSYELNILQTLDFEGNMSEPSRRSMHQVAFDEEDNDVNDLAYSMVSVTESDWEAKFYANVSAAFTVPPSVE